MSATELQVDKIARALDRIAGALERIEQFEMDHTCTTCKAFAKSDGAVAVAPPHYCSVGCDQIAKYACSCARCELGELGKRFYACSAECLLQRTCSR